MSVSGGFRSFRPQVDSAQTLELFVCNQEINVAYSLNKYMYYN